MRSFRWYVNRIKAMSAPEISARVGHWLTNRARQLGIFTAKHPEPPKVRESTRWIRADESSNARNYVEAANRMIGGELSVFSLSNSADSGDREWNRDPLTGVLAPMRFGLSIDVHSQKEVGDIKYLWEPNRHLEMVLLARAFAITEDPKYLRFLREQLNSWFEQCPYLKGPNWSSSLELAIRLISWAITWQVVNTRRSSFFDGDDGKRFRNRWLQSIFQHVHFIRANYSRFSSANNHLIGEASGCFIATCTWPYWKDFEKWRSDAREILIGTAHSQVFSDGVSREQAISYQQFVLDFFILSGLAGNACGVKFPDQYWHTVEQLIEFIYAILDVNGNVPMIGDSDDGFVVKLSQENDFCPYRSLLATGAILFDRPDFAAKSGGLDDKTRFLLGTGNWHDLIARGTDKQNIGPREFSEGGYYILGDKLDSEDETRIIVDSGPLGFLSIAAHGHSDALAIYLSVAGREFLVDPGTYTYHGKPEWRAYFRGTRAHNTVTVDRMDQSVQQGAFMWTQHAAARCIKFETGTDGDTFIGEHNGYARLSDPVIHERAISRVGKNFEVVDTLRCRYAHLVERFWHFSEQCSVIVSGREVYAENDGIKICLSVQNSNTRISVLRASDNPIGGWVSRTFGAKSPSASVCFIDDIVGTTTLSVSIQCLVK